MVADGANHGIHVANAAAIGLDDADSKRKLAGGLAVALRPKYQ